MSSSRNTPTPSGLNEDRPLTQADLNEYYQLFEEARQHRPESPTLPPSPPASYTGPSPASSTSSRKRKRDDNGSLDLDSLPAKRPRHLGYHIPPRIRRGPIANKDKGPISNHHHEIGRGFKRQGDAEDLKRTRDSDDWTKAMLISAHLYGKGILNFAFGYCLRSDADWLGLRNLVEVTFERFNKVFLNTHDAKLEVWLAYLQYFKLACEIQHDRQRIAKFRSELSGFIKQAELSNSVAPAQAGPSASGSTITKSPSNLDISSNPSHPSTPLPVTTDSKKDTLPSPVYTWDMVHSKELHRLLLHTVAGPHNGDSRRKILKLLNAATLRTHFPRTFVRAFGEDGVGHTSSSAEDSPSFRAQENIAPLELWEDQEIHDLELNEKDGGDFPYPHHPENVVWVVVLGRSLLTELDIPDSL